MDIRSVPYVDYWLFLSKFSCANTVSYLCRNHDAMMLRFIRVFVFTVLFLQNLPLLPASVGSERDFWESGMGCTVEILTGCMSQSFLFPWRPSWNSNSATIIVEIPWWRCPSSFGYEKLSCNTIAGWIMITLSSCQSWNWCYWICNSGYSSITWTCINLQDSTNVNVKVNSNNE